MLRLLQRPVQLRPASPRVRRIFLAALVALAVLNALDVGTTILLLSRGSHEGNPWQAALFTRAGWLCLVGYKMTVVLVGVSVGRLGFRWVPRTTTAAVLLADALVAVAVANNTYWLVGHP